VAAQIEARAAHPELENKVLLVHDDRSWTYQQYRDESVRMARFLRRRLGRSTTTARDTSRCCSTTTSNCSLCTAAPRTAV
jgi:hypothetical protein